MGPGVITLTTSWGGVYASQSGLLRYREPEIGRVVIDPPDIFNVVDEVYTLEVTGANFGMRREDRGSGHTKMIISGRSCLNVSVLSNS